MPAGDSAAQFDCTAMATPNEAYNRTIVSYIGCTNNNRLELIKEKLKLVEASQVGSKT